MKLGNEIILAILITYLRYAASRNTPKCSENGILEPERALWKFGCCRTSLGGYVRYRKDAGFHCCPGTGNVYLVSEEFCYYNEITGRNEIKKRYTEDENICQDAYRYTGEHICCIMSGYEFGRRHTRKLGYICDGENYIAEGSKVRVPPQPSTELRNRCQAQTSAEDLQDIIKRGAYLYSGRLIKDANSGTFSINTVQIIQPRRSNKLLIRRSADSILLNNAEEFCLDDITTNCDILIVSKKAARGKKLLLRHNKTIVLTPLCDNQ